MCVISNFVSSIFGKSKSPEIGKSKSPVLKKNRSVLLDKSIETDIDEKKKRKDLYVVQSKGISNQRHKQEPDI